MPYSTTQDLLAQAHGGYGPGGIRNPVFGGTLEYLLALPADATYSTFFRILISRFIMLIFIVGSIAFFFMMVIGALQWIASGGNKEAVEAAKSRITHALVGILILFSSYAIIKLIGLIIGVDLLILDIGALKI